MFRKLSSKINSAPKLEIVVCDEGHRLKNTGGSKTVVAMRLNISFLFVVCGHLICEWSLNLFSALVVPICEWY